MFKKIDSKMDLPKVENEVLDFWDKENIFKRSLEIRKNATRYSFYDGPPFATGTPHYGHIVASTMKDVVPRYWTMRGYYVERVWGWDCHGLPIENIAEKSLGITHKKEILELGVEKFNETCRSKVLEYVGEWESVIRRLGRWADMKNSYKTMDLPYMESVWWVFRELWDRGLIYEGYRSMHVCPRCETTLSQSEVSEGYKDVKDLSVIAEFRLIDEENTSVLAWTTTPWTLLGNVALAVGKEIDYVEIEKKDQGNGELVRFILAKDRLEQIFGKDNYKIIKQMRGEELSGRSYEPLFDYYAKDETLKNRQNGWKIYPADFVTTEEGTGVVHIAPAFGEDDLNLGNELKLPFIQHVGMDGIIEPKARDFAGMHVKPIDNIQKTDVEIIKYLAGKSLLFDKEQYLHSYPHCWRCDTPLINYATSSWFVSISKIKETMIDRAKSINWSPSYIKKGRFGKWLEGARDWSISRQRFWASVIPIWKCRDCGEIKVIGSREELEKLSGQKVSDLHKHIVDKIAMPCNCGGEMVRIPDVLDTWFDSGSMPFAEVHYPFENKEKFEQSFPTEFIAEGIDQTRAWFYYLHVIGTAIKDSPAYKNVIVNGIVLAEDGKKMSKRLQNYPDPMTMFDKYGADVMRFYLLNSPVMQAENLNFTENDMADLARGMFRMLWNSYSFFVLYANIDNWNPEAEKEGKPENVLDRWVLSELNALIENVNKNMERYDLVRATRLFAPFIDNLSNWYIRRSRKRFWKSENDADKNEAYLTLYKVLLTLSKLMAPFTPFVSEEIYKNLTKKESVHLEDYPVADNSLINAKLNEEMNIARTVIESGLAMRAKHNIKVRQPLASLKYGGKNLEKPFEDIIADEVNVKEVRYDKDLTGVEIDTVITEDLRDEGIVRDLVRNIQSLRKTADFKVEDRIMLFYETESEMLNKVMHDHLSDIAKEVLALEIKKPDQEFEAKETYKLGEFGSITIGINRVR